MESTANSNAVESTANSNAVEYAKFIADPAYACNAYGIIDDPQSLGGSAGVMPFALWPAQVLLIWQLLTNRLVIILKARQLGISWLCCWYALWTCLTRPGAVVLLFSKGQSEANELIRRIAVLYARLPEWLKAEGPALVKANTEELGWSNEARIHSLPATQSAGRSFTATLVVLDEAAFLQWANALYTALKPTIDAGGQLIILSTANGVGNLFHRLWVNAAAQLNGFLPVFLPWWSRPGRDAAWYARQQREYTDPLMVKQEYPASADEAFVASGRVRFAPEWIQAQSANIRPSIPRIEWPKGLQGITQGLAIYDRPRRSRRYVIGADVAEGLEHRDYSAAVLIDAETWHEVASLHGHWEPDVFADLLIALAEPYRAELLVERNNHGHAVLATFKLRRFKALRGRDNKPGWLTNAQTKPISIDALAVALRDKLCAIHTQAALNELSIYRIEDDGNTSAPEGYHDDFVMAWAIALCAVKRPRLASSNVDFYARTAPAAAPPRAARSNEEIERMLDG